MAFIRSIVYLNCHILFFVNKNIEIYEHNGSQHSLHHGISNTNSGSADTRTSGLRETPHHMFVVQSTQIDLEVFRKGTIGLWI